MGGIMSKISRILVPVDSGPMSEELLRYGIAWADFFDSELHVLHVTSCLLPPPGVASVGLHPNAVIGDWVRESKCALDGLIGGLPIERTRVRTAVRVGSPGGEIERYAAEQRIDLIVMASRRRGTVARALGSVAEQVVRKAPCPVITVPPEVKIPHWLGAIEAMVLPVDLGETSETALAYARELATALGSVLHVLHVATPPWERQLTYLPSAAVITDMERLTGIRAESTDATGNLRSTIRVGDAATRIEDYVEEHHAGLIVMATHGRSTFAQIVLSGVTRKLLAHATCPVLTLNARVCRQQEMKAFNERIAKNLMAV
jgi:nucleotide-binding universal stress UspA family protein